jgi:hypothetical protein
MSTVKATLRVLSILVGTLSLVSFAQAMFNVGLVPALEEIITFYRGIAANVFGLLTMLIGFIPPQSVLDFWTLSFLGASAYFRTQGIEQSRALRGLNLNPQSLWWRVGLLLIFGFSGLGLVVVLSAVHPLTYILDLCWGDCLFRRERLCAEQIDVLCQRSTFRVAPYGGEPWKGGRVTIA